jgi:hypothetical protein
MSIIMQRKSNARAGTQQEPLLPGVAVTVPGLPTSANGDVLVHIDKRPFFKLNPKLWGKKQSLQLMLFVYALFDFAVAGTIKQKRKHQAISIFGTTNDIVSLAIFLFIFEGFLYTVLSLFVFHTYCGLIEREVNPFSIINSIVTGCIIFASFQIFFSKDANNPAAPPMQDVAMTIFCAMLVPMLQLIIEHCLFYIKSLVRLNARSAVKLEMMLPIALYIATQAVLVIKVYHDSIVIQTSNPKLFAKFETICMLFMFQSFLTFVWAMFNTSYVRFTFMSQMITLAIHFLFALTFTSM